MPECSFAYSSRRLKSYSLYPGEIICFLMLWLAFAGCQSPGAPSSDIEFDWTIDPAPPRVGSAAVTITLRDSTGQLLTGADLQLEANMSHPGMKPVFATAEETAPGEYRAVIEFTMGGDWFILIKAVLDDERVVEQQIAVPAVRSQ